MAQAKRKYRIALVSDFFYPNTGGVESHLFQLAQCLIELGHKVIIITHYYGNRRGIRYMTNGLKVYYLTHAMPFYNKAVLPTIVCGVPPLRHIFKTENVDIVHGHSAFSTLAHEALFTASLLGLATVFTDHSLFGFADASAVVTNTFLKYSLANTDRCICVSHTGKENTVLRTDVPQHKVYVIPNAVDSKVFKPDYERWESGDPLKTGRVVVAIGSRLVYRKGIDLVAKIIPAITSRTYSAVDPSSDRMVDVRVNFLVGGDGPKRILFEEMIERHNLQDRVRMLGELSHSRVRDQLLVGAHIFLNTSLTEAFCMAIVEAVSCGLTVVSTKVGGIPEVLPDKFIYFVEPNPQSVVNGLEKAIVDVIEGKTARPSECHAFVETAYNWRDVAKRTNSVYDGIISERWENEDLGSEKENRDLARRVKNLWDCGRLAGSLMAALYLFCHYWILILNFLDSMAK